MFLTSGLNISGGMTIGTPSDSTSIYNITLINGNYGANGSNNSTIVDSSPYNISISVTGTSSARGSFSPYDLNFSTWFNGSSDFLTLPSDNTAFALGTGNFTIEFWVNITSTPGANGYYIYDSRPIVTSGFYPSIYVASDRTVRFLTNSADRITSSAISLGVWNHVALVRNFGTTVMYLNGTATGSPYTDTNTYIPGIPQIGASWLGSSTRGGYLFGCISNLRVTRQALYTANFTPPTATLTTTSQGAIASNVAVLLCSGNRHGDFSSNNFTVTVAGNPHIYGFSPFVLPYSYNPDSATQLYAGSQYFSGSERLQLSSGAGLYSFGTGDFTVEFWMNIMTADGSLAMIIDTRQSGGNISTWQFYRTITSNRMVWTDGLGGTLTSNATITRTGGWVHVAYTRTGTTGRMFINGQLDSTQTDTRNYAVTNTVAYIGQDYNTTPGNPFTGCLAGIRIVRGTSLYTSSFTPPTQPPGVVGNTVTLLNFNNTNITDRSMNSNWVVAGNTSLSSAVTLYNPTSLFFDGTGDYLLPGYPSNLFGSSMTPFYFGTLPWTIEFWYYQTVTNLTPMIVDFRTANSQVVPTIYKDNSNVFYYMVSFTNQITGTRQIPVNSWVHVAVCKSGTSTRLFVNGIQDGATYTDNNDYASNLSRPVIGAAGPNLTLNNLSGYLDDIRITRGLARYTANFTPPQGPLPLA